MYKFLIDIGLFFFLSGAPVDQVVKRLSSRRQLGASTPTTHPAAHTSKCPWQRYSALNCRCCTIPPHVWMDNTANDWVIPCKVSTRAPSIWIDRLNRSMPSWNKKNKEGEGKKERISYQGLLQCGPHQNFIRTPIFCLCGTTQAVDLSHCVPTFHLFLWKINRKQCVTCVIHLLISGSVTFHSDEAFTSCGTPFCQACFRSADNMRHYCLCITSHTKKKKNTHGVPKDFMN